MRLLRQFKSPLVYILLVSAGITAALTVAGRDMLPDTMVIVGVVILNAWLGFFQEGKAENALDVLKTMTVAECTALRDGAPVRIPARTLVPGDLRPRSLAGYPVAYSFLAAVSLVVAAIPEMLPVIGAAIPALAATAKARRKALIRRLPAAETLGCTSIICSDKTGSLTRDETTVDQHAVIGDPTEGALLVAAM